LRQMPRVRSASLSQDQISRKPGADGNTTQNELLDMPQLLTETEDVNVQVLPTDKVRIINRLLRMQEDYAISSMTIASEPEKLVIEITVKE